MHGWDLLPLTMPPPQSTRRGALALAVFLRTARSQLVFNEFASGDNFALDDYTDDWFEIYNNGSSTVDLDGWVVMDDHSTGSQFAETGTTLAAGAYLVVSELGGASFAYHRSSAVPACLSVRLWWPPPPSFARRNNDTT